MNDAKEPLVSIRDLRVNFDTRKGDVKALNGINLDIYKGEILGLVGETGCGKSMTAFSILNLIPSPGRIVSGEVRFAGEDLLKKSETEMRKIRGSRISMIFQDPRAYLNPVFTVGDQLISTIMLHFKESFECAPREENARRVHSKDTSYLIENEKLRGQKDESCFREKGGPSKPKKLSKGELKRIAKSRALDMLRLVRLSDVEILLKKYPHELSGGMCQRVMIGMALSCQPELLIADEATTNLDVTIQAQILRLLQDLKDRSNTLLVITHDLGVVAEFCDRVGVMYAGRIVEIAESGDFFKNSVHPYTLGLLGCIPRIRSNIDVLETISGNVSSLITPPSGCAFHPRCPSSRDICREEKPELMEVERSHFVACHGG